MITLQEIFLNVLDMSIVASVVIVIVLCARLILKKIPKCFSYILWSVVLFRLLCPFSIESTFSLIPSQVQSISQDSALNEEISPESAAGVEYGANGDSLNGGLVMNTVNLGTSKESSPITTGAYNTQIWLMFFSYLWLVGIAILLIYSIVSLIRLRHKLVGAGKLRDNIFLADHIASPFVMGLMRPRIYLPSTLSEREQEYIILHEQCHIRRFDHVMKLLAHFALCLHWFNPFVWIAFVLSNKDMEMSCDESVMRRMNTDIRCEYSTSLLSLATGHRIIAGTPLAFGEGDTKGRIKNVMNYKKPTFWVVIVAVIVLFVVGVGGMTNPFIRETDLMGANYQVDKVVYDDTTFSITPENQPYYCITADYQMYQQNSIEDTWNHIGKLEEYQLTKEDLNRYNVKAGWDSKYRLHDIAKSYMIPDANGDNNFYLVLQTKSGDTLLAYGWEDVNERGQGASDDTNIQWMLKLKNTSTEGSVDIDFLDFSLSSAIGVNVNSFSFYENDATPGFIIVGFLSDGSGLESDMGFGVLQFRNNRYKLLDYHVYPDAAINGDKIYVAEHAAIADVNGVISEKTAYDVILSCNEELESVTRTMNGRPKTFETVGSSPSMNLLPWIEKGSGSEEEVQYNFQVGQESVTISPESSGIKVKYGDAKIVLPWYESGFDFNYDNVPTLKVSSEQEELIIEVNPVDIEELIVSEDYYLNTENATKVEKGTYTLKRDEDGHFKLPLPATSDSDATVVYFAQYHDGVYVFRVVFE